MQRFIKVGFWAVAGLVLLGIIGAALGDDETNTDDSDVATVLVPDVVGDDLKDARKQLEAIGLDVEAVDAHGDRSIWVESNWRVTDQDPEAGATVDDGDRIRLLVEKPGDTTDESDDAKTTGDAATTTTTQAPTTTSEARNDGEVPRGKPAKVVKVVDGDTVHVDRSGQTLKIRIVGIDTPETVHPGKPVQCYGPEASRRAEELMGGKTVGIEYDDSQGRLDRYGRTLAFIWLPDGRLYTEVMLEEGFAEEYTYDGAYKYLERHRAAQDRARQDGRGLWAHDTCNGDTEQPDPNTPVPTTRTPAPQAPSGGRGGEVYYENCAAARAAGAAPIHRGEPGYREALDGDRDGVACE